MSIQDARLVEAVDSFIGKRTEELVELVRTMVGCSTVSVDLSPGSEHRENEEARIQALLGDRLAGLGAGVDQFEPDADALRNHPMMPPWHHWKGRPITVATLKGAGGGRSLVVNGHIDVVSPRSSSAGRPRPSRPTFAMGESTAAERLTLRAASRRRSSLWRRLPRTG